MKRVASKAPVLARLAVLIATILSTSGMALHAQTPPDKAKTAVERGSNLTVAHLANDVLNIYVGEQNSDHWEYQYAPGSWGESCYHEHFAVYAQGMGTVESESMAVNTPFADPGGVPGTVTAVLSAGSIQVTRQVSLPPGDARYFQFLYVVRNTSASTLYDVRFFQTIDFDIPQTGDHTDDYGWYDAATDYIGVRDDEFFRNGIASNIRSTRHGLDYWYDEVYNDWDDGDLNNADSFGPGDPAVGKQFNLGNLAAGQERQIILTIWSGNPILVEEPSITGVTFMGNEQEHHTAYYADDLVFRRAQWLDVRVTVDGDYDETHHDIRWLLTAPGGNQSYLTAWDPTVDTRTTWSFKQSALTGSTKDAQILIPSDAAAGEYRLTAELYKNDGSGTLRLDSETPDPFYVIFNPWNDDGDGVYDDDVYRAAFTDGELEHYVLGIATVNGSRTFDTGFNYYPSGTATSTWDLGSSTHDVFKLAMDQIDGEADAAQAMERLTDRATGVICGCWDLRPFLGCGDCGYGDIGWEDVPDMIEEYVDSGGRERPIGQCLDFAGLTNALARAVGIPSRMLTCVLGNHPTYRYHAWDEVWLNGVDSSEWAVADATPGELGGVGTRCADAVQDYNIDYATGVYAFDARSGSKDEFLSEYQDCQPRAGAAAAPAQTVALAVATGAPEYTFQDVVEIEVTVSNQTHSSLTRDLAVAVAGSVPEGAHYVPVYTFPVRTVTVGGDSSTVESYTLTPQQYGISGEFRATASMAGVEAYGDFSVQGGVDVRLTLPQAGDVGDSVGVSLDVENRLPDTVNNVHVGVYFPPESAAVNGPVTFTIPSLAPGEVVRHTWTMTLLEPGAGQIKALVYAHEGGVDRAHASIAMRGDARVVSRLDRVGPVPRNNSFAITGTIANYGHKAATNVQATLVLPPGLTTSDLLTKSVGDIPGGEQRAVAWTVTALAEGNQPIGMDTVESSVGSSSAANQLVAVYSYDHELSIAADTAAVPGNQTSRVLLTLHNPGGLQDRVVLNSWTDAQGVSFSIYDGGIPIIHGPVLVPAGSSRSLELVVTAAAGARGQVRVSAVSELDPTAGDSATILVGAQHVLYLPAAARAAHAPTGPAWQPGANLESRAVYGLAVAPGACSTVYAATDAGVFKSTDGGVWWQPTGLNAMLAAQSPDRASRPFERAGETAAAATLVSAITTDPLDGQVVYATPWGRGIYKSMDGGASWAPINAGLGDLWLYAVAADPGNRLVLYAAGSSGGVFKSSDGGASWASASAGLGNVNVRSLAVAASPGQVLYAGTQGGVYKSVDGGAWWTPTGALGTGTPWALVVDRTDAQTVYAALGGGGVYKSTNGGASWVAANYGLGDWDLRALIAHPAGPQTLYVGSNGNGVYVSDNGATTWRMMNLGLGNGLIKTLALGAGCPTLHAGTAGGAWWYGP